MPTTRLFAFVACSGFFVSTLCAAPGSFNVADIISAPFASSPVAAPTGATVAWLENEQGKRNIYIASAPDWKGRKLTNFDQDDGQEIAELSWAPDASYLLFTRGGDFETGRDNPNPAVTPEKPAQDIWIVRLDGGAPKKLTDGHASAISPKGDMVAFLRAGQIFAMSATGQNVHSIVAQMGHQSDLRWSPDGTKLAFVSARGDHAFIGIYAPQAKALRYVDASVDRDFSPAWAPDSSRIAYIRIPASRRAFEFGPVREAEPWSVRVTDLNTGFAHEAFHAKDGVGSAFHPVVAEDQLFWGAGDHLVFPWERTGWCHLYSVPVAGENVTELTPGTGEVEHVSISKDGKTMYFAANFNDIDRRHLWSVGVAGGQTPKAVTDGQNIEWEPTPAADGSSVVFLGSSYNEPSHALVRTSSGIKPLTPGLIPASFPSSQLVQPQPVIITAADGMQIHGQLFLPPSSNGERHPALLFFHGGSRRQMLLGFHYMDYYSNAYAMNQFLANHGYVVLAVNYRSGIGYGLDFREALNYGATGASEFNDVMGAGLYLKSRPDVDPARIGLWGGSYGGYLTAMGLARASDLFAAGVDFHGVHDWNEVIRNFAPGYDPRVQADAARLAFASSPLASISTWKSPVLLIQGDDDRNVPFSETVHLAEDLRKHHVPFEQLIFPNEIHGFLLQRTWIEAYTATADFFARKLPASSSEARAGQ